MPSEKTAKDLACGGGCDAMIAKRFCGTTTEAKTSRQTPPSLSDEIAGNLSPIEERVMARQSRVVQQITKKGHSIAAILLGQEFPLLLYYLFLAAPHKRRTHDTRLLSSRSLQCTSPFWRMNSVIPWWIYSRDVPQTRVGPAIQKQRTEYPEDLVDLGCVCACCCCVCFGSLFGLA